MHALTCSAVVVQALVGESMRKGYHTIVSKHERSALLMPIRDQVMAAFAGEGTTWTGKAASNRHGDSGGGDSTTYDAKEVKVALKVSH